jgi:hypothetical protein
MSKFPKLKVENFTVSYSFDTHLNGKKSNHFVSMGFRFDEPITIEEAQILQVQASQIVTVSTVHDAVTRGAIPVSEAKDIIADIKLRHEGLAEKLSENLDPNV